MKILCRFFLLVSVFLISTPVFSHELNTSYSSIEINGNRVTTTFIIDVTDLEKSLRLDLNGDGETSAAELDSNLAGIQDYITRNVEIRLSGKPVDFSDAVTRVKIDSLGNVFAELTLVTESNKEVRTIELGLDIFKDFGPRHKNLVKVITKQGLQQAILTVHYPQETFLSGEQSIWGSIVQYLWLGIEHIFIGYDHILFLLGLIVIGGSFRNLVKMVTAFTVAHSITLILATFEVVQIPSRFVESVIALSIVYIAAENFFIKTSDERWLITFVFGLMHGFGFAGVLRELGLPTEGLVASLLSFNVGVEIGQVAIICIAFPVVYYISRTRRQRQFVYTFSAVILVFGLTWFIERAFGLDLPII